MNKDIRKYIANCTLFCREKNQGSVLPFANGRDTRVTIWQNCHRFGNRMWNLHFLGDPESGWLNLETHQLTLAIAKKTLGENHFRNAQKMDRKPPSLQIGNRVYFKTKQPGKWYLKWRPGYRIVCIEHDWHYLHIKNQAMGKTRSYSVKDIVHEPPIEFWNINTQFGRVGKYINHPANLPTITLTNWTWTPNSCK